MKDRTLRGKVAIAGIGETKYYKHGQAPDSEFALALQAILRACADAGIDPRQIDGFASYSNDRNDPSRIAAALGLPALRFSNMQWGGGGGGGSAAVGNAAAAVAGGVADCVVVFRALAQGQFQRFGSAPPGSAVSGEAALTFPYGLISPAQRFAMRVMRFMHDYGIRQEAQRAIALASYHHAQSNPRAVMHGRPLTEEAYDASRWIVEPFRLFDCCMENDGAAAVIVVSAERARDLKPRPAFLLGVAQGSEYRNAARGHNAPLYATSSFTTVAPQLYEMAGIGPKDVRGGPELRELHRRRAHEPGRARLLHRRGGQRLPRRGQPDRSQGPPAAQHQRRQPGRVLHARPRAGDRGGAAGPRRIHEPGAGRRGVHGDLGPHGHAGLEPDPGRRGDAVTPTAAYYLPAGMPAPVPEPDGLDKPYWEGTRRGELMVQRCQKCRAWQWGPEWICHACLSFEMGWTRVEGRGTIYSWERAWHPVHPALKDHGPYIVVLVELPEAGGIRMLGNLLGDPHQAVTIGAQVEAVFEPHDDAKVPFTLVHWKASERSSS